MSEKRFSPRCPKHRRGRYHPECDACTPIGREELDAKCAHVRARDAWVGPYKAWRVEFTRLRT